jgi:hypothetical protein
MMFNLVSRCAHETYLRTTLSSSLFVFFFLLPAWVSTVSRTLCNPCDQGRVDIILKHVRVCRKGMKKNLSVVLFASTLHVCETRANYKQSVGFGCACLFWIVWWTGIINQRNFGLVDMGRREWASKPQLPARCTMFFVRGVLSRRYALTLSLGRL